ncbi:DegT/DnrJ/EryC1/StrS family aminotransferase [Amylibacter sp.]|nr:DegT/DnrJ/EryC1/StrS family aminotransferase [Amylibacter sp.]
MNKLAILGGTPVRTTPFSSQPHIGETEKKYVTECLDEKMFSRFIGSPVPGYRDQLRLSSEEAANSQAFWSVLGGKYVRLFEAEFAKKHDVKYAISMNSATSCLTAALIACGIQPGDEVVTTALSFTATATSISLMGGKAVCVDVSPETYCMDMQSLEKAVTEKTKAIIPVHLLGNAGNIAEIKMFCEDRDIVLIEDTAQALHSKKDNVFLGSFGSIGVFSFQESKNIMTGEGGMAITDDPELAYRLRLIRNHGEALVDETDAPERIKAALGYNYRLPEILAAIGYAQAQKIEFLNNIRKENFEYLQKGLKSFSFLKFQQITNDPGQFFPYCVGMRFDSADYGVSRDLFALALRSEGIPVSTGFPRLMNENLINDSQIKTPVAHKLNYEEYLAFFLVGQPNNRSDMQDIINAFEKLSTYRVELQKAEPNFTISREYDSGRGS